MKNMLVIVDIEQVNNCWESRIQFGENSFQKHKNQFYFQSLFAIKKKKSAKKV